MNVSNVGFGNWRTCNRKRKLEQKLSITTSKHTEKGIDLNLGYKRLPYVSFSGGFVKPVDLEGYKRWLSFVGGDSEDLEVKSDLICEGLQHQGTVNTACVNVKQKMELEGRGSTGVHISAEQSDDGQGGDVVEVRSDSVHCGEENLTETINTECCLSFSEILHIVDTGQEIPGLKKLNILPTNQNPTVSHLLPKPKPWDITN